MRRLRRYAILALILLLGFGLGFIAFLHVAAAPPATDARADGIAVLTGGADRVATGLRLLREGRGRRMLISGVHRDVTLEDLVEAEALATLTRRVELGRAAATTRGNAEEIAAWVRAHGLTSILVVTAGYHMPRAMLELRRQLPGVELLPWPVVPPRLRQATAIGEARTWTLLLGEYAKFLLVWTGLPAAVMGPA